MSKAFVAECRYSTSHPAISDQMQLGSGDLFDNVPQQAKLIMQIVNGKIKGVER
jgi:hypothetical protein